MQHIFTIALGASYVGLWLQSFREFPPRQKPGSFNLERVMEAVTSSGNKGSQGSFRIRQQDSRYRLKVFRMKKKPKN